MVVDASALVAVVLLEEETGELLVKLAQAPTVKVSAVTLVEASVVLLARGGQIQVDVLDALIARVRARIVPVDESQSLIARAAFDRYGKGRHEAGLNFGDCFTYALAKHYGEPVLFKGNDFSKTDLIRA
jgi:ribonuclease VapC